MIIQNEWLEGWEIQYQVLHTITQSCTNYYGIPCDCSAIIKEFHKLDILDLEYISDY